MHIHIRLTDTALWFQIACSHLDIHLSKKLACLEKKMMVVILNRRCDRVECRLVDDVRATKSRKLEERRGTLLHMTSHLSGDMIDICQKVVVRF